MENQDQDGNQLFYAALYETGDGNLCFVGLQGLLGVTKTDAKVKARAFKHSLLDKANAVMTGRVQALRIPEDLNRYPMIIVEDDTSAEEHNKIPLVFVAGPKFVAGLVLTAMQNAVSEDGFTREEKAMVICSGIVWQRVINPLSMVGLPTTNALRAYWERIKQSKNYQCRQNIAMNLPMDLVTAVLVVCGIIGVKRVEDINSLNFTDTITIQKEVQIAQSEITEAQAQDS